MGVEKSIWFIISILLNLLRNKVGMEIKFLNRVGNNVGFSTLESAWDPYTGGVAELGPPTQ